MNELFDSASVGYDILILGSVFLLVGGMGLCLVAMLLFIEENVDD